jgi:hypothetical protein
MWNLEDLKRNRDVIDQIDWEMTPEKAIETYLEWGTGWARKHDFVRYLGQESFYFVIYDWEEPPRVTLVRRNARDMAEIAKLEAPSQFIRSSIEEAGRKPGVGVYAPNADLKRWLKEMLGC